MEKNKLLNKLLELREYAQKDRRVAVSRARELILDHFLKTDKDVKDALRQIEHNQPRRNS